MSYWRKLSKGNQPRELEVVFIAGELEDCGIKIKTVMAARRRINSDEFSDAGVGECVTDREMSQYTFTHWMRMPEHPNA